MFWGLIMEPGRCYTQTVKISFHVSMAALDISNSSDEPAQVMCVFEGRNYLLCTLNKNDKLQCPLDLNFETGSKVSFATNGKSHVHLTGYLTGMDDETEEEEEVEEEEEQTVQKDKKRLKKLTEGPPKKKTKIIPNSEPSVEEEEDDDSSDSDFDLDKLIKQESGDEEEDDEEGEEEESDDEDAEEVSSLSELESAEEEEEQQQEKVTKPKQNGVSNKANSTPFPKKKKDQQQEKPKKEEKKKDQKQPPKGKKFNLKGGVIAQDLKEGNGEVVKSGKFVHVYYEGRLKDNNKVFDSTTKGPGFSFRVGKGEVIKGWDNGLIGMKVGGKRRLICPPGAAYGPKGSPPVIPPNATLVFDVEIKKVS